MTYMISIYSKKILSFIWILYFITYLCDVVLNVHFNRYIMNRFLQKIIDEASKLVKEEFGIKECSKTFNVDYSNMCAYVRGSKIMPLELACQILEYFDCRIVVFQSKKRF